MAYLFILCRQHSTRHDNVFSNLTINFKACFHTRQPRKKNKNQKTLTSPTADDKTLMHVKEACTRFMRLTASTMADVTSPRPRRMAKGYILQLADCLAWSGFVANLLPESDGGPDWGSQEPPSAQVGSHYPRVEQRGAREGSRTSPVTVGCTS